MFPQPSDLGWDASHFTLGHYVQPAMGTLSSPYKPERRRPSRSPGSEVPPKRGQMDCVLRVPVSLHRAKRGLKRKCLLAWIDEVNLPTETGPALPAGYIRSNHI